MPGLAYPCGVVPGFDPSHVASAGISPAHGFSVVPSGSGAINLLQGAPGVLSTGSVNPTGTVDGVIGPAIVQTSASSKCWNFSGQSTANDSLAVLASFVMFTSLGAQSGLCTTDAATANGGMALEVRASNVFSLNNGGNSYISSTLGTFAANVPYFIAASTNGLTANFVLVNLSTGQTTTQVITSTVTSVASNGVYSTMGSPPRGPAIAKYGPQMFGPSYLSQAQLLQWAADPWSFWYPQKDN